VRNGLESANTGRPAAGDGRGGSATETGERVVFLISDAFLPDAAALRAAFADERELEGTVVGFSDWGDARRVFAVVEVIQQRNIVVPVESLRRPGGGEAGRFEQKEK